MMDTIYALSSGIPPAAIAVVRVSGPHACTALKVLAGGVLPRARHATFRKLRDSSGTILDSALVLWLPGPGTATGEDICELHLHGGRAVVAAVERALAEIPGLRRATPGEFTRRAFLNGRIDLAEAEGLADLLTAETELQRRSALAMAGGTFSCVLEEWRERLLEASASLEAVLDFSDEDDVIEVSADLSTRVHGLRAEMAEWLDRPRAEALREGFKVVLAGPPNAGKSTLFNVLVECEAAIATPVAGTTRDVLTRPVAMEGVPFVFADTAGLRNEAGDVVEAIGVERAWGAVRDADLVLWLGREGEGPGRSWEIEAQIDRQHPDYPKVRPRYRVSAVTGEGLPALRTALVAEARLHLPTPGQAALNERQHGLLAQACDMLEGIEEMHDPLLVAEQLRLARLAFDALVGRTATEDMLDGLFGRFCIGK